MAKKVIKIEAVRQSVMQTMRPKKRACAYCRVSTDSTKQHKSYVAQLDYYRKYIGKREDWEFVGIFADEAVSGIQLTNRDEFNQMIKACENGNIDVIITKSVTRFARNTVDSIETIRKLKAIGVAVFFEKENINTMSEESELMITILSSLAQGESESISTNLRWGIQKRFKDGTYNLSSIALGYTKCTDGELVIKQEEAWIVRRIFQSFLNGKGGYTIAKELNHEQVPTTKRAQIWDMNTVNKILSNPIYEGDLVLQKTYNTVAIPYKKKKNYGELPQYIITDNHEPIITREQGELVREILSYRRKQYGMLNKHKYNNRYVLSGKIECSQCGSVFKRQKLSIGKANERIQWSCKNHILNSIECTMKPITEELINSAYLSMWNKLVSNYTYILLPLLESLKNLRKNNQQEEIESLNEKIMELTEQSHILSRVVQKGYIDSALFIQKQNAINIEIEETKKSRNNLLRSNGFENEIKGTERLIEIIKYNPEIMDQYEENLFENTVDRILINQNGTITFKLINGLGLVESTIMR